MDFSYELLKETSELKFLMENDLVEFHYRLRGIIKKSYTYNFRYLRELITMFRQEIIPNGIFYIDVINESIEYFFSQNARKEEGEIEEYILLFDFLSLICDKQSLEIMNSIIKKIPSRFKEQKEKLQLVYKQVFNHIQSIDEKIKEYTLSPQKGIIVNWY